MNYACAIGALVAGQEGANPKISDVEIKKYMMLKQTESNPMDGDCIIRKKGEFAKKCVKFI